MPAHLPDRAGRTAGARTVFVAVLAALVFLLSASIALGPAAWTQRELQLIAPYRAQLTPAWLAGMNLLNMLHSAGAIVIYTVPLVLWLGWRCIGQRSWASLALLALPVGLLANQVIKHAVGRERPVVALGLAKASATYSFPSGHTFGAAVLYLLLASLLWPRLRAPWQRSATAAVGVLMVLAVAASRVGVGAHFISDVVGAAAAGVLWWLFARAVVRPVG